MNLKMPKFINQSIIILFVGLALLVVFALAFIFPANKSMAKLDADIAATKAKIEVQEQLGPVYRALIDKLNTIDKKAVLVPSKPISRGQLGSFSATIAGMAQRSKMVLVAVYPDPVSTEAGVYYVNLRGHYTDFRNFLAELGSLPYLSNVQELKVYTASGIREFNIKMKLLVA